MFDNVGMVTFPSVSMEKVSVDSTDQNSLAVLNFDRRLSTSGRGGLKMRSSNGDDEGEGEKCKPIDAGVNEKCCVGSALGPVHCSK